MLIFIGLFTAFAASLGVGVAYNSARIALSERSRELATLRVLGFTRAEIAYILLAELALLVAAAVFGDAYREGRAALPQEAAPEKPPAA